MGAWQFLTRSFSSLENRNYRRFFIGQSVSLVGTWMQSVAQSWLVLELTGSGTDLGLVVGVQTLPVLLLAPYGGVVADRADKRRLLLVTQSTLALLALTLGLLDLTHVVRLWMVICVAAGLGLANALDNPTRQAFVSEMVGPDDVANAVSLNSVMVNVARAIGPAIAGVLIVTAGVSGCFLINAASFIAILVALATMNTARLRPVQAVTHSPGQLLEGFRYVRATPRLLTPLLMMALIGALAYEFQVVLPLLARRTFHGNADAYGYLTSTFGLGAVVGGIVVASRRSRGLHSVTVRGGRLRSHDARRRRGPQLRARAACARLSPARRASRSWRAATPRCSWRRLAQMRGRVMALWAVGFIGTTPIGGPIVGYVSQHAGPRWGLALGGLAALTATALAVIPYYRRRLLNPLEPGADQLPPGAGPS